MADLQTQIIPDTWEFRVKGQIFAGIPTTWAFWLREGSTAINQAFVDASAVLVEGAVNSAALEARLAGTVQWTELVATNYGVYPRVQYSSLHTMLTGTNGGQLLPPATAGVISWRTANIGASYRGRTFVGGFTEGDNDGGMSVTAKNALSDFAADLVAAFADAGPPEQFIGVVSRFSGTELVQVGDQVLKRPKVRDEGIITAITSASVAQQWRVQRRREIP